MMGLVKRARISASEVAKVACLGFNADFSRTSPLTENLDNVKRMEDAGAAAIVFHSLFEEQLHDGRHGGFSGLDQGTERFAEPLPNIPRPESFRVDPHQYLEHLCRAKASVQVPIIASLNGHTEGGWIEFAKQIR
jgi:dihydroorotate dehydrogenase (fumarate)